MSGAVAEWTREARTRRIPWVVDERGSRVGAKLAPLQDRTSPLVRGSGARREPAAVAIRTRPEGEP